MDDGPAQLVNDCFDSSGVTKSVCLTRLGVCAATGGGIQRPAGTAAALASGNQRVGGRVTLGARAQKVRGLDAVTVVTGTRRVTVQLAVEHFAGAAAVRDYTGSTC